MRISFSYRSFQRICFLHQGSTEQLKLFVLELLKYLNKQDIVEKFRDWKCPVPPLSGKFLKDNNCPDGVAMGRVRQILIGKWIDSRFKLTQDDLGGLIPGILDSLKEFIAEQANKRTGSGKRKLASAAKN